MYTQREERQIHHITPDESVRLTCETDGESNPQHPAQSINEFGVEYTALDELYTPNSYGSRKQWKPFQHYKCWSEVSDGSSTRCRYRVNAIDLGVIPHDNHTYTGLAQSPVAGYRADYIVGSVFPFGNPGELDYGLTPFCNRSDAGGNFVPPPESYETMKQVALNKLLPVIKGELSTLNSFIELKDFVRLPQQIKTLVKYLRYLPSKAATAKKLLASLGQGSDAYLQFKFAFAPLVSDILAFHKALSRVERRMNDLITRAGRVQRRHYSFRWTEFANIANETTSTYPHAYQPGKWCRDHYQSWRSVDYEPSEFHAEIEYNYNFTQYQLEHARLLALYDALGLNLNPAIIWNAIPFSFLIDWVLGVGRYLDQFQLKNMEPQINITGFLTSVKRSRRIMVWTRMYRLASETPLDGSVKRLPVVRQTAYRRDVGLPSRSWIESSGLSPTEFSLGAALVIASRRYHHRVRPKRTAPPKRRA